MTHFTIPIPQGSRRVGNAIALSRDGSRLAFVGGPQRQIFIRDMGQVEVRPIPGITAAGYLSLSPDGQWISYVSEDRLNRVAVAGGPVQFLANAPAQAAPPTQRWETDGFIWFTTGGVVRRVPEGGGKEEAIATPDTSQGEGGFFAPQLLPGGKKLLVSSLGSPSKVMVIDLGTGTKTVLLEGPEGAQFAPIDGVNSTQGHLIYFDVNTQTLMGAAFDTGKLRVQGAAVPLIEKIQAGQGPLAWFDISPSGTLAYVPDTSLAAADSTIVWVNQKGEEQPVPGKARRYNGEPRISPDGTKAAILVTTGIPTPDNRIPGGGDIWVVDLERGTSNPVTRQENIRNFVWSHDGKRIIYSRLVFANRGRSSASGGSPSSEAAETSVSQLFSTTADGVGKPILLKERPSTTPYVPFSVARDGTLIGGNRGSANAPNTLARRGQSGELWLLSTTQADADVRPFRNFPFWVFNARFSPDDRLVAYQSADSDQFEIYVVPYPGKDGERVPVSAGGGTDPRWSARELIYRNGDKVIKVDVLPNGKFGLAKTLFEKPGAYDVHPDGRLLMIRPVALSNTPPEMHIIVHWFEDLRRRVSQ
jgi:WD40-like Beta Propeller Repeat